jgi:hypothetical protein
MIRWMKDRIDAYGHRYTNFIESRARLASKGDLVFWLIAFGLFWAFAWNAHVIGPWVDNLMGWGPHDIDSEGKVRWRRIWSTAICLPGILACIGLYIRNRRK